MSQCLKLLCREEDLRKTLIKMNGQFYMILIDLCKPL